MVLVLMAMVTGVEVIGGGVVTVLFPGVMVVIPKSRQVIVYDCGWLGLLDVGVMVAERGDGSGAKEVILVALVHAKDWQKESPGGLGFSQVNLAWSQWVRRGCLKGGLGILVRVWLMFARG